LLTLRLSETFLKQSLVIESYLMDFKQLSIDPIEVNKIMKNYLLIMFR